MSKKCNYNIEWRVEKHLVDFEDAVKFMERNVEEIIQQQARQLIWILEHHPIYTAGISAKDEDIIDKNNIKIVKTNRGGKYTYHCPGMKIIYVMLDLKKLFYPAKPDIAKFVKFLENWIIDTLKHYKINAQIRNGRVGIWVETDAGEKKISAIGIKIKKWVSYHGVALNVSPELVGFKNIVPCGLKEFGVTSLTELGVKNFNEKNFLKILQKEFYNNLETLQKSY